VFCAFFLVSFLCRAGARCRRFSVAFCSGWGRGRTTPMPRWAGTVGRTGKSLGAVEARVRHWNPAEALIVSPPHGRRAVCQEDPYALCVTGPLDTHCSAPSGSVVVGGACFPETHARHISRVSFSKGTFPASTVAGNKPNPNLPPLLLCTSNVYPNLTIPIPSSLLFSSPTEAYLTHTGSGSTTCRAVRSTENISRTEGLLSGDFVRGGRERAPFVGAGYDAQKFDVGQ
ncbi:hypothetical protein C8R47DRAFT_1254335, partial [Mycena vitilis]